MAGPAVPPKATAALARFAAHLSYATLPEPVRQKAQMHALDFVGVALAGSRVAEIVTITELTGSRGAHPVASVIGTSLRTSAADAAYVNGCAADVLEHQDGYRFGGFHPSHALPALLAVAEAEDRSIGDLLAATVAAYEVANRIGRAVHPQATVAGWFPTAAGYGAAAGCARLLGLDPGEIASAVGAAAFFVPAVMIEAIFSGHTVKPAFSGQLARAGAEAALHVKAGLAGWPEILESPHGLIDLLGGMSGLPQLAKDLGQDWTILDVHLKRFAGCRHTHGAAQACIELATQHELDPRTIVDIDVETYDVAKTLTGRTPGPGDSAIRCTLYLHYVAAVAVVDRELSGPQYAPGRITDELVTDLAGKVRIRVSGDLDARYPEFTATRVTITTGDGRQVQRQVDMPDGDTRVPLSLADLRRKFGSYARASVGEAAADHIEHLMLTPLPDAPVRELTAALQM
ncbi:MAG: MmgE/PrpD family protein [Streptosporangiaceae bacterium]